MNKLKTGMKLLIAVLFSAGLVGCGDSELILTNVGEVKELIATVGEEAYYEGQKDAIEGDIRIERLESGGYAWNKSPWDNGKKPTFLPPIEKTAN